MSGRPAVITQASIARAIRAAKQAGASEVDVRPDGTVRIRLRNTADDTETIDQERVIAL